MLTFDAVVAKNEAHERARAEKASMSQTAATFVSMLNLSAAPPASLSQSHMTLPTPTIRPGQ